MDTNQLKIEIERIVEPVHAEMRLKNKFRQELWTHLSELYEEESETTPDSNAAAQRALERLGKPDELRAQLRQSMKLFERIEGFGAYWMEPRKGVPLFREILRLSFSSFFLTYGMMLALAVGLWISSKDITLDKVLFLLTVGVSISLTSGVFGALYPWVEDTFRGTANDRKPSLEFFKKALVLSIVLAIAIPASGIVVHFAGYTFLANILGPDHRTVVLFDYLDAALWRMFGTLLFIGLHVAILSGGFFSGRLPDWPYADAE